MARSWTRLDPCRICGGYGGAYDKQYRCRGFVPKGQKGRGRLTLFCEKPNAEKVYNFLGFNLYRYEVDA